MSEEKTQRDSLNSGTKSIEPSICDPKYNGAAFSKVYTSTREFPPKWYVRCIYNNSGFYEPVKDLRDKPTLNGDWKYSRGRAPSEPDSWVCERSYEGCKFFARADAILEKSGVPSKRDGADMNQSAYKKK
jgi:hypothetical protein